MLLAILNEQRPNDERRPRQAGVVKTPAGRNGRDVGT